MGLNDIRFVIVRGKLDKYQRRAIDKHLFIPEPHIHIRTHTLTPTYMYSNVGVRIVITFIAIS